MEHTLLHKLVKLSNILDNCGCYEHADNLTRIIHKIYSQSINEKKIVSAQYQQYGQYPQMPYYGQYPPMQQYSPPVTTYQYDPNDPRYTGNQEGGDQQASGFFEGVMNNVQKDNQLKASSSRYKQLCDKILSNPTSSADAVALANYCKSKGYK